jgi:hypothetical protein
MIARPGEFELLVVRESCARAVVRSPSGRALKTVSALAMCVGLGACSLVSEALWPSMGRSTPAATTTRIEIPPAPGEQRAATPVAATSAAPASAATGTAVGQRAGQLREESSRLQSLVSTHGQALQQMRGENVDAAQRYQTLVGQINARLQVGTTPGNPILTSQWAQAQGELDRFAANIGTLSQLSGQVGSDASLGSYLLESVRNAYALSGALEDDHRQLAVVEDEVNRIMVSIDRMRVELSEDIARQSAYVSRERANMTTLASAIRSGEFFGPGLAARAFNTGPSARAVASLPSGSRPLVVIRFDRNTPNYEQALYTAVNRALELRPQATFDIVGVAASGGGGGGAAIATANVRRQAEQVMRSLIDMGMPTQRLRLSASNDPSLAANEVQVFVR